MSLAVVVWIVCGVGLAAIVVEYRYWRWRMQRQDRDLELAVNRSYHRLVDEYEEGVYRSNLRSETRRAA